MLRVSWQLELLAAVREAAQGDRGVAELRVMGSAAGGPAVMDG